VSKVDVLLGLQWGDEGKGKVVDVLAPDYDVVARFQGGPNAGHTLVFNGKKHVLHCLPSGIFQENTMNLIGNGMVLDPVLLRDEINEVSSSASDVVQRLIIAQKTHLILPTHRLLDAAYEKKKGKQAIGSTLRGIGPTYTDKVARRGLRVGDIHSSDFDKRLDKLTTEHHELLKWLDYDVSFEKEMKEWLSAIEVLRSIKLVDDSYFIHQQLQAGKRVLAEGAQGTLLDISYGSYPFVTSSHTISGGVCTGLGVAPNQIGKVFGVFKAYCTRVGSGPFPTELFDKTGEKIQKNGKEFGATTGRERRCGWLDLVALKYACMINGVDELFMMKGDVLSGFERLSVATNYLDADGEAIAGVPFDFADETVTPRYDELDGWSEDVSGLSHWSDLPKQFHDYVAFIEDKLDTPVSIASVGPDREQTIKREMDNEYK
jgi:adenylosuccinate synthase